MLEAQLKHRPTRAEVRNKGLLPQSQVSSSLRGVAAKLELQMKKDTLKSGLLTRSSRSELAKRGIMPKSKLAPSLVGIGARLEKKIKTDHIRQSLERRPKREELIRRGILIDKSPMEAAEAAFERRVLLEDFLAKRPSRREVERRLSTVAVASHGLARQVRQQREERIGWEAERRERRERKWEAEQHSADRHVHHVSRSRVQMSLLQKRWAQSRARVGSVRARVAVALKVAARLQALGYIDATGRGALKEKVFGGNPAVFRCVQDFEEDGDGDALVEALLRLAA